MTVQYFLPGVSFDDGDEFFELLMAVLHDLDDMSGGFVETDYEESASQIKTRFSDEDETTHITAWEDFVARLRYVEATAPDAKSPQFRRGFSAGLNSYPFLLPCIGPCSQDRQSRPSKTPCVP